MVAFRRKAAAGGRSFLVTFITVVVVAAFLSPILHSFFTSIKSPPQLTDQNAPLYPASPARLTYDGQDYDVYEVPTPDKGIQTLALIKKGRTSSHS